jgi:2'-5' RNA ligase
METALLIVIDDAEPFDEVRREFAVETFALGIPFHVTLLYPFAPVVTDGLAAEAHEFFAERPTFEFELTRIGVWPRVVYAVPEPDEALRECMAALFTRFPDWPPYGGLHKEVIPHATLGEEIDGPAVRDEIERRVGPHLPRRCQARDVALWEEVTPDRWRERDRFPLAA